MGNFRANMYINTIFVPEALTILWEMQINLKNQTNQCEVITVIGYFQGEDCVSIGI